ncbi:hypothetical protein [Nocardioides sp. SYSU DS0651]|uniref:hypothetical protein n=1 Tax=Nocardioides sp. SYSU DS0651 TaxID=3415955 RepID=UPI003F4B0258
MSNQPEPRPGQATLAGALVIAGSVAVVLAAWQRISSLHTLEVQDGLRQALAEPPLSEAGIGIEGLTTTVRVLCMVAGGAATASAILGFQVYKRSRSARIALTALAPVLLVAGFATDSLFAPLTVAGITLLWLQPTRDWYAGRPWVQRFEERRAERLASLRPPGAAPGPPAAGPPRAGAGTSGPAAAAPPRPAAGRRPSALIWAIVLTWTGAVFVTVTMLAAIPALLDRDTLAEQVERVEEQQGRSLESMNLTEDMFLAMMIAIVAAIVLWCLAALVLATLVLRGRNWARITLAVSGACAAPAALAGALVGSPLVLVAAASGIASWLLLRPDVSAWFRR